MDGGRDAVQMDHREGIGADGEELCVFVVCGGVWLCSGCPKQVQVLSSLHHPHIVAYKEHFMRNGDLHLIMQYCESGDLASLIKEAKEHFEEEVGFLVWLNGFSSSLPHFLQPQQIIDWFAQLCSALKYCHHRRILHRDLKSSNVFLTRVKDVS